MLTHFYTYKPLRLWKVTLALLAVVFAQQVEACPKDKPFRRLSRPEKVWTVLHPFKARKVYLCAQRARFVTDSLEKDGTLLDKNGGQLDAFRHAYWMALMIESGLPERAVRKVGENHEKGNYLDFKKGKLEDSVRADSMSCVMDLKNNDVGISLGNEFMRGDKSVTLIRLILIHIWNGKLFILRKDAAGKYLNCEDEVINMEKYEGKWSIPKCLVSSDKIIVNH